MSLIIQFTGLSGAGKTTLAYGLKERLAAHAIGVEVVDGDEFRKTYGRDLGFSKADRMENIRRMAAHAASLRTDRLVIMAAINPYEAMRQQVAREYGAKTVWIKCALDELIRRDHKGLYRRALLPEGHEHWLPNLSGVNDCYEPPICADLVVETDTQAQSACLQQLTRFTRGLFADQSGAQLL